MALIKSMKKLGRYDLLRVLGKGAMGLVYEGRVPNLDRRVAIKTIKVENLTAEEAADNEMRSPTKARSAARLQHPHIVTVFDSNRDGDLAYLVMEPSGRLKLTDFGVARIQDSGYATRTQGSMVGTLKYMSPEQVKGQPIDARSDLFAPKAAMPAVSSPNEPAAPALVDPLTTCC